ncbi:MAG TPA: hypothetical protein VNT54_18085 [Solirubrobacteraceae bacterium]|nr:hypothetical protein [Solirubrobacteraceae bacterium]
MTAARAQAGPHGRPLRLRIDRIAVQLTDELRPREVERTLRTALELLAARLARAPLGAAADAPVRALELLTLGPVPPDWLAGPGAAARLADELYERIARGAA